MPESEIISQLSDILDDMSMDFTMIIRKILLATMMKTKIGSTDMQLFVLEGLLAGEMMPSEIGRIFCISRPNVTTLVNKLITHGYAQRLHDDKDKRVIRIRITDKGKRIVMKRRRIMKEYVLNASSRLDAAEINEIYKSLENTRKLLIKLNSVL